MRCLLVVAVLSLLSASPAQVAIPTVPEAPPAGAWNQWRGPDRSGHCPGPIWPERLTEESFVRQWRVELEPSYSGPIVDAERVFTTETVLGESETIRAVDRKTGETLWTTEWLGAMKVPFFAARNGSWIRSTPAHDGESIYVAGMRDVLVCLDIETGDERWRVDFTERYECGIPAFGFVCSPLVDDRHVYVQAAGSFVKLDKRTGESVWRTLEDGGGMNGGAFSSPVRATVAGRDMLLVQGRDALFGVDAETGDELWQVAVKTFRGMNILTPQPFGDGVFTSAYGGRAHFFRPVATDAGWKIDAAWNSRAQGYMTSPVVIDGHAYLYLRSKRFTCVDLATGESSWISEPIGDEYWSLVAQGDRILALTNAGELYLIRATPEEFDVIDRIEISESETWAHLAVDGDQVFVREQDGMSAFSWR